MDQAKIVSITLMNFQMTIIYFHGNMGNTRYYRNIIINYDKISMHLEKLLKKNADFIWTLEFQEKNDLLKENLVTMPNLVFFYWTKLFHVNAEASKTTLGVVFGSTM